MKSRDGWLTSAIDCQQKSCMNHIWPDKLRPEEELQSNRLFPCLGVEHNFQDFSFTGKMQVGFVHPPMWMVTAATQVVEFGEGEPGKPIIISQTIIYPTGMRNLIDEFTVCMAKEVKLISPDSYRKCPEVRGLEKPAREALKTFVNLMVFVV